MDVSMKWTTYLDSTLYDLTIRYVHVFFCINNGTHHHEKSFSFIPHTRHGPQLGALKIVSLRQ